MAMKKTLGKSSGRSMLSGKTWKTWDVVLVIGFCLKPRTGFKKRQEKSRSDFQWSFTSCWQMACQPAHSKGWLFVYLTGECDQAGSKCEGVRRERCTKWSCSTFFDPVDYSPPGSSVHGTLQARILECPFPSPGDLPDPGTEPPSLTSPAVAGGFFYH